MPSSAVMPVCSRLLPSPLGLRARPPLVWRPSAAISAGSHRASRPASPSAPRLAALSGHLCGLAPSHPPCEPVHSSSGGPQWPSPRARTVPSGLRAHPPLVWRPSAAISKGSHRTSRPASPSGPRLAALSGHLCGLALRQPPCEPVHPSPGGPQRPSPRARAAPAALRARPPLVWRPSVAISTGSRRAIPPCHSTVPFYL